MAINLPCRQPSRRGILIKAHALSHWRKCSLWRASSTFRYWSALSSAAKELMPVSVVQSQVEKHGWPQRWHRQGTERHYCPSHASAGGLEMHSHSTGDTVQLCISSPVVWSPCLSEAPVHACALLLKMCLTSLTFSLDLYIPRLALKNTTKKKRQSCLYFVCSFWDMTSDSVWQVYIGATLSDDSLEMCSDVTVQTPPSLCLCAGVK